MARTKTSSIIKTRSQSRTGARTGTNDRTIDSAAPVAVAARTIERTTDPVPVTDDLLFAGRPKTGALKDPPPVPRDRDSDADAKKPAAKPKG